MKNRILPMICLSLLWAQQGFASTATKVRQANRLYADKEYEAAAAKYNEALDKEPESGIIHYNAGTSLYKSGRYNDSIQHLQRALLSDDDALKQKASYNLGNALYKAGMAREKQDSGFAILSLEKALGHYEQAIKLDGKDEDAKANYEFVKKEIERLKLQQQQQQQQQDQQQQQQQDQQQQQKDQQQQQQQEQQDNSQQQPQDQGGDQQEPQDPQGEQEQQPQDDGSDGQEEPSQDGSQKPEASDEQDTPQKQPQESEDQQKQEGGQDEPRDNDQEEKEEGEGGNEQPSDYNNQMQEGTQGRDEGELTTNEAQMLLRGFEQREQPQKLLNVFRGKLDTAPVEKDW